MLRPLSTNNREEWISGNMTEEYNVIIGNSNLEYNLITRAFLDNLSSNTHIIGKEADRRVHFPICYEKLYE